MIAAVYARKSTDQSAVPDDAKSITRQVAHARAFAAARGWTVDDAHVYTDDGISGAIFGAGRPGLLRLLNALRPAPPFDALILAEESRLGREMHQTAHVFGEIIRAGVRVWFYLDGRERTLDTALDKMMLSLTTFAAELEREKARQRTRDALLRKAQAGHVTGGRVFGYDNVRQDTGHVTRVINDAEAAVVRRIFALAAHGHGLRVIAHTLNAEGAPCPRPQRGRPAGWAPSTIREMLERPLYRGILEWDRARRDGQRRQLARHANPDPLRLAAPELALVPPALAAQVDAIRGDRRARYLTATGALRGGRTPRRVRYLLAGLLQCPCGATLEAVGAAYGKRRGGVYVCSAYRRKGAAVCPQDVHLPIAETDAAIIGVIERELLDPAALETALSRALDQLTDDRSRREDEAERARVQRELQHLVQAVTAGGPVATLVAEIRAREARLLALDRALARPRIDRGRLARELRAVQGDLVAILHGDPTAGQQTLRGLLRGPIRLSAPQGRQVPWRATGVLGPLLGTVCGQVASPTGGALSAQGRAMGGRLSAA